MEAMCKQIHNTLTREFKYALVWGVSAKHSPQRVGLTHQLADEDVVQVRSLYNYVARCCHVFKVVHQVDTKCGSSMISMF
jgi:hypothetical protein